MARTRAREEKQQRAKAPASRLQRGKATKKQLRAREGEWLDLVNNAAVGVFRASDKGKFLLANREMARIFGFDAPDGFLESVPNISMIYRNTADGSRLLNELKARGLVNGAEVQARRPDNRDIWISINSRKTEQTAGGVVFEGFVTDITARKKTEESLLDSERRFRMLVEQAGDAFFIHDYEGKIFDVNRRACETLGYERQELLGMRISDVDIEVQKKKHRFRFWERLGPGEFVTFEGIQTRKDGGTFPVEVRLGRLDLGDQILFLSLTRDITERKRADDTLRAALRTSGHSRRRRAASARCRAAGL